MMTFTEKMLEKICLDVNGTTEVKVGDNVISFKAPFPRVTMAQAIKDHTGVDINGMGEEELRITGKYDESVIVVPKGSSLSIHEFDGLRPCTIKK